MGNVVVATIAVILFVCGLALIGLSFGYPDPVLPIMFVGGILLISAAIGVPPWLLNKLEG
jgi:hypothetical protein